MASGVPALLPLPLPVPKWGSVGILGRQLWSFAGDDDRRDVNQFLLEPFVNYNLDKGWFLLTDLVMTANWDAPSSQRWTIPLGGGFGRVFKIGESGDQLATGILLQCRETGRCAQSS